MCGSVVIAVFDERRVWWYQVIEDNVNILRVDHTRRNDIVAVLNGSFNPQKEFRGNCYAGPLTRFDHVLLGKGFDLNCAGGSSPLKTRHVAL